MSTLAALPDAVTGATLREAAPSLRALGIPADEVARRLFRLLYKKTGIDTAAEALSLLGLPATPASLAVLRSLGFTGDDSAHLDPALRQQIVTALESGVWSAIVIAEELHCAIEDVHQVIADPGYGLQPYGTSVYGGRCKATSENGNTVTRRVNVVGQMSYRRRVYTLGRPYRGRVASIRDDGMWLRVIFGDRAALQLARRL